MSDKKSLIILIGGNGRIGRNFYLIAMKNKNFNILNVDPSEDLEQENNLKNKENYFHLKIPIGNLDSAIEIIKIIKEKFTNKKIISIVNCSRVRATESDDILINNNNVIDNINSQLTGINNLINLLVNENNIRNFSIIHIGSLSSRLVNQQSVLYHYLKGAIEVASKALAFKLGKYNIRSNVIVCGLVKDPNFELSDKQKKIEKKVVPLLSGPPTTEDITNLILFFISKDSRAITGSSLVIDAGMSLPDSYTLLSNLNEFN